MTTSGSWRRDAAALVFAMSFPCLMAWLYLVALATEAGADVKGSAAVQVAFGLGKFVQFAFPAFYVWRFEPSRLRPRRPMAAGLLLGIAFGLAVAVSLFAAFLALRARTTLFEHTSQAVHQLLLDMNVATPGRFVALATFYSICHSLLEEYYWRWFVFVLLRRHLPLAPAATLSGLGFMAHHVVLLYVYFPGQFWMLAVPLSLCIAVGGAFWAWLYDRTGSLYASWVSHGLVDAALMAVGAVLLGPIWASVQVR